MNQTNMQYIHSVNAAATNKNLQSAFFLVFTKRPYNPSVREKKEEQT